MKVYDLVSKGLQEYIVENVLPLYESENVDAGHKLDHIESVIDRSLGFAEAYNRMHGDKLSYDMVYTIGAYHDVGLFSALRKDHELVSAEMLSDDEGLRQFFYPQAINAMAEAVREHRASYNGVPSSVYGRIVSQADRSTDLDSIVYRSYAYRMNSGLTDDEMISEMIEHISSKYGPDGYCKNKVWFEDKALENFFDRVGYLSEHMDEFRDFVKTKIVEYRKTAPVSAAPDAKAVSSDKESDEFIISKVLRKGQEMEERMDQAETDNSVDMRHAAVNFVFWT